MVRFSNTACGNFENKNTPALERMVARKRYMAAMMLLEVMMMMMMMLAT